MILKWCKQMHNGYKLVFNSSQHNLCSLLQDDMEELTCVECGRLLDDKVAVYHHVIDSHRKRYCLFCEHEEGFRPKMRLHIVATHPTVVYLDAMGGRLWHSANETVQTLDGEDSYSVECVAVEGFIPPQGSVIWLWDWLHFVRTDGVCGDAACVSVAGGWGWRRPPGRVSPA